MAQAKIDEREKIISQAKIGDQVKIHYSESLKDGSFLDSSMEKEPLEFTLGDKMVIAGVEKAIIGMCEGDLKTVTIPPEEAYGVYEKNRILVIKKTQIPAHIDPQLGMILQIRSQEGVVSNFIIKTIHAETITLDGNHPLAGKELTFELKLIEIV